ncbi:fimbria/pilus periplasmic chaperone, partial [Enterobacter kobei]|nr:fimbria/pilus periplasmic chaperone [Enterobacter kobei]
MNVISKALLSAAVIMASLSQASAGVIIGGTRVIFDGGKKEASISINNADEAPYLIQSWIEMPEGNAKEGANKSPNA